MKPIFLTLAILASWWAVNAVVSLMATPLEDPKYYRKGQMSMALDIIAAALWGIYSAL